MPSPDSTTVPTSTAVTAPPNCSICCRMMDAISSGFTAIGLLLWRLKDSITGSTLQPPNLHCATASRFRRFHLSLPGADVLRVLAIVPVGVLGETHEHCPALHLHVQNLHGHVAQRLGRRPG